jgi:CDP-glucose 4,6-dehydratase
VGKRRGAMENVVNAAFWAGRRVLVTGHTGFKGSWLVLWLRELGAEVSGYSHPNPVSNPSLFTLAGVGADCDDHRGDICDRVLLEKALASFQPEIVLHLAAQPLVRASYRDPVETWRVNVQGTLALLEACRSCKSVRAIVVVTTDKVYENPERGEPFRESDPLGGHDPYSSSKAACEILCASWRRSFLEADGRAVGLATARAGNVIGGGDYAEDRLVPDLVRASISGSETRLRYPDAVRPWQHVLEPLRGYLMLAERLFVDPSGFGGAFNFGPNRDDFQPVRTLADRTCVLLGAKWVHEISPQPHEAGLLRLNSALAHERIGWAPRLSFDETVKWTALWYAAQLRGESARELALGQLREYGRTRP